MLTHALNESLPRFVVVHQIVVPTPKYVWWKMHAVQTVTLVQ